MDVVYAASMRLTRKRRYLFEIVVGAVCLRLASFVKRGAGLGHLIAIVNQFSRAQRSDTAPSVRAMETLSHQELQCHLVS